MVVGILNEPRKYVYPRERWLRSPVVKTLRKLFIVYSAQMNKTPLAMSLVFPRERLSGLNAFFKLHYSTKLSKVLILISR